jgi:hypothetical protein
MRFALPLYYRMRDGCYYIHYLLTRFLLDGDDDYSWQDGHRSPDDRRLTQRRDHVRSTFSAPFSAMYCVHLCIVNHISFVSQPSCIRLGLSNSNFKATEFSGECKKTQHTIA